MPRTGVESSLDDAFRALAHDTRRQVLFRLMGPDSNPKISIPEEVHVGSSDIEELHSTLHHHHLPLLNDLEFVTWDEEVRTVSRGAEFDVIRPVLEQLVEHPTDVAED